MPAPTAWPVGWANRGFSVNGTPGRRQRMRGTTRRGFSGDHAPPFTTLTLGRHVASTRMSPCPAFPLDPPVRPLYGADLISQSELLSSVAGGRCRRSEVPSNSLEGRPAHRPPAFARLLCIRAYWYRKQLVRLSVLCERASRNRPQIAHFRQKAVLERRLRPNSFRFDAAAMIPGRGLSQATAGPWRQTRALTVNR